MYVRTYSEEKPFIRTVLTLTLFESMCHSLFFFGEFAKSTTEKRPELCFICSAKPAHGGFVPQNSNKENFKVVAIRFR